MICWDSPLSFFFGEKLEHQLMTSRRIVVWGEDQLDQRGITDKNPDGEEGDGEEVADEDEGFLDQTGQQPNGAANWSNLEVAETATLKSFEVFVY